MMDKKQLFNVWILKKNVEEAGGDFKKIERDVEDLLSKFLTDEYKDDAALKEFKTTIDNEKVKWTNAGLLKIFDDFS